MKSVLTIILGVVIAWFIVSFFSTNKSTYLERLVLHPADFESSPIMQENPALIGTGLASRPSVMDATPSSQAQPVMMGAMNMSPISVSRPQMPPAMNPQQQMPPAMSPQMMPPAMNPQMPPAMNPQMPAMNPQMPSMNPQMPSMNPQMPSMNPQR